MAKIGDLGIASSSNKPLGGSRKYMPPEFYTRKCTQKLDVFTFGLTFNELFNGNFKDNYSKLFSLLSTAQHLLYCSYAKAKKI